MDESEIIRQMTRQIRLFLDDGNRDRLIVALALVDEPEGDSWGR